MHPLHKIVGSQIKGNDFPHCKIKRDPACADPSSGRYQSLPLFCSDDKKNETEYCNVDMLIIREDKVRVIIEIEEADIKPTQICGKFLTSALSSYFIHESEKDPIPMDDSVLFIQVLDTSKLKMSKTSKIKQWKNLEKSINNILPIKGGNIKEYKLFYDNPLEFEKGKSNELVNCIKKALI